MKTIRRITVRVLLALVISSIACVCDAATSVGKIIKMEIRQDEKTADGAVFEIWIEPAEKDVEGDTALGILPDFTEKSVVMDHKGAVLETTLDQVGAYGLHAPKRHGIDFIKKITINDRSGSYLNPELQNTESGLEIKSAEIVVTATEAIYCEKIEVDRGKPESLILRLTMRRGQPVRGDRVRTTAVIEMPDIDIGPAGKVVPQIRKDEFLKKLEGMEDDAFVTVLFPLAHIPANDARDIISHKLSLLGTVAVDQNNPALLITDRCDYVRSIVETLPLIDRPIPQVLIEVKILEVAWNQKERMGFAWGVTNWHSDGDFFEGGISTGVDGDTSLPSAIIASGGKISGSRLDVFNAQVELLSKEGKVNVLATPKLRVLNNATASFHAGLRIPVFKKTSVVRARTRSDDRDIDNAAREVVLGTYSERTVDDDQSVTTTEKEEFIDVGVDLSVTPRITSGDITIELTPSVSEVAGWQSSSNIPIIESRKITTKVRVRSGDSVLIAGLFKENEVSMSKGIPGLRRVPLVRGLFSSKKKHSEKLEVVFLLRISLVD